MDRFNTPWRVTSAAIYTTPTDSRVYGGMHFRFATTDGQELGRRVAQHVLKYGFRRIP